MAGSTHAQAMMVEDLWREVAGEPFAGSPDPTGGLLRDL
jgi:hypothetical protein